MLHVKLWSQVTYGNTYHTLLRPSSLSLDVIRLIKGKRGVTREIEHKERIEELVTHARIHENHTICLMESPRSLDPFPLTLSC